MSGNCSGGKWYLCARRQYQRLSLIHISQNPIEQEGTYPLPEAQVDRFMLKVGIDYPKLEEEKLIIRQNINCLLYTSPSTRSRCALSLKYPLMVEWVYTFTGI